MYCFGVFTQEQARIHFNCSDVRGVELENQGGGGTASSHWEQRVFGVNANSNEYWHLVLPHLVLVAMHIPCVKFTYKKKFEYTE